MANEARIATGLGKDRTAAAAFENSFQYTQERIWVVDISDERPQCVACSHYQALRRSPHAIQQKSMVEGMRRLPRLALYDDSRTRILMQCEILPVRDHGSHDKAIARYGL
jgi:hypothetical protein